MTVAIAIWSTVVPAGEEPIEVQLVADVRITNAALGETLVDENGRTTLKIVYRPPKAERMLEKGEDMDEEEEEDDEDDSDDEEPKEVVLCSLTPGKIEQTTMDLILEANTAYLFEAVGKNDIHLSGNYIDQVGDDEDDMPPSDEEDEEDFDLRDVGSDVEVDADGLDELDDEDAGRFEEVVEQAVMAAPAGKKRARESDAMDTDAPATVTTTTVSVTTEKPSKAEKKKAKKLKAADGSAVPAGEPAAAAPAPAATPAATPAGKEKKAKKDKEAKEPAADAAKTKELAGGLKYTDAKVGTGKVAKKGNKVSMRYIGKLTNGKVFDKNTKGDPFKFNLGAGEVIKGWDEGIIGMQVGGERVLTVPPALGYGKRGAGPDIPPNATLVFEVKCLEIK